MQAHATIEGPGHSSGMSLFPDSGALFDAGFLTLAQGGSTDAALGATPSEAAPAGAQPAGGTGAARSPGLFGGGGIIWVMFAVLAVIMIQSMLFNRKEKKKREALLSNLSRGAKVQTIGGVIGTVQEQRGEEVLLLVDQPSNTRIRFKRSAVQQVIDEGPKKSGKSTDENANNTEAEDADASKEEAAV